MVNHAFTLKSFTLKLKRNKKLKSFFKTNDQVQHRSQSELSFSISKYIHIKKKNLQQNTHPRFACHPKANPLPPILKCSFRGELCLLLGNMDKIDSENLKNAVKIYTMTHTEKSQRNIYIKKCSQFSLEAIFIG